MVMLISTEFLLSRQFLWSNMGEELEVQDPISNGYDDGVNKTSRLRLNRLHVFSFRFDPLTVQ